jgi:hypothetical protein
MGQPQPGEMSIPEAVSSWCRQWLNDDPREVLFRVGHLSEVTGLRLASGLAVVLKVRPPSERMRACALVQRHLWRAGFPCPELLAGPAPLGDLTATAEALVEGGEQLPWAADAPRLFAQALARLVALAPSAASLPTLEPSPPWVGWDHAGPGTWPRPDDLAADLNAQIGPAWLEDAGSRVRRRLVRPGGLPAVVGHADWESQNVRWVDRRLRQRSCRSNLHGPRPGPGLSDVGRVRRCDRYLTVQATDGTLRSRPAQSLTNLGFESEPGR